MQNALACLTKQNIRNVNAGPLEIEAINLSGPRPSCASPSLTTLNVMMRDQFRHSPISELACSLTMAPDKQNNGTPAKPFTPTMSTAFRTTKSPLTPKLAGHVLPHTPHKSPLDDLPNLTSKLGTFTPV